MNKNYMNKRSLFLIPIILLIFISLPVARVEAAQAAISVYPPELEVRIGDPFTVSIIVTDMEDLWAYELKLYYDNTILEAMEEGTEIPEGHFLTPKDPTKIIVLHDGVIDQTEGYVSFALSLLPPEPGRTGSDVLATVTFKGTAIVETSLDLRDVMLISLIDSEAEEIPPETYAVNDGYITVTEEPPPPPPPLSKLYVEPTSILDPTLVPGKTFTINISIANATDLYGFEFKLSYNTSILDGKDVTIPPFLQEPVSVVKEINKTLGFVWVKVTSTAAEPVSESGTLATITFEVIGEGSCVIDLYETKLLDFAGESIKHAVEDGRFTNMEVAPEPPVASFTFHPEAPKVDEAVTLDASASHDPDGYIVSYAWDFGDETLGDGVTTDHAYASDGTYTVTLTVTDDDGLTNAATAEITVTLVEPPPAFPIELAIAAIVVVAIGGILIFFYTRRKRSQEPKKPTFSIP